MLKKSSVITWLKTACSALFMASCLTLGLSQAADQGPRHHAYGEYDRPTATNQVPRGTTRPKTAR